MFTVPIPAAACVPLTCRPCRFPLPLSSPSHVHRADSRCRLCPPPLATMPIPAAACVPLPVPRPTLRHARPQCSPVSSLSTGSQVGRGRRHAARGGVLAVTGRVRGGRGQGARPGGTGRTWLPNQSGLAVTGPDWAWSRPAGPVTGGRVEHGTRVKRPEGAWREGRVRGSCRT
jgi:hypothetical protein